MPGDAEYHPLRALKPVLEDRQFPEKSPARRKVLSVHYWALPSSRTAPSWRELGSESWNEEIRTGPRYP
jgi:hypothetical protein